MTDARRMSGWSDEELVEEGRKLAGKLSAAQLRLGQLALAYAPLGSASVKSGSYDRLQEYADLVGVEFTTMLGYRTIANAWAGQNVDDMGFTVLKALSPVPAKRTMLDMLRSKEPPNGRAWTVDAACKLAKRHDLWPHGGIKDRQGLVLRRTAALHDDIAQLARRFEKHEFSAEERALVARQLAEIQLEVGRLVEAFASGQAPTSVAA